MTGTWALVPVKSPARAKTRLYTVMQPDECARLSIAMLDDMLDALNASTLIAGVAVLTDDESIAQEASTRGNRVIRDESDDLCSSLRLAADQLSRDGAETVLVIPGDLPTILAADIDRLLTRHDRGLSICPAIRDGGTNALVCTPPNAVPFCFGTDSAARHLEAAARHDIPAERLPMTAFFRDIDLADDLAWLLNQSAGQNTLEFLRTSGISARLGPATLGATE